MKSSLIFAVFLGLFALSVAVEVSIVDSEKIVKDQYIVIFREDITDEARIAHMSMLTKGFATEFFENSIIDTYSIGDYKGYAAKLSPRMLSMVKQSSVVSLIEQDSIVSISQSCSSQNGATWGLDRIAERAMNLDGIYRYGVTGTGIDAYIVDTGILITHTNFGGRAIWGANYVDNSNTDCNGHGTHVAGTVGSTTYGVAKQVTLIAVKVLNCAGSGTNAGVISGINWVASSYASRKRPSVANMSLGGGKSTATDNAVAAGVKAGVTFAVASGNDNADACNYSPASAATAISVGATGTDANGNQQVDNRAYFSNFGTCVHVFAPGLSITSTWIGSNSAINTISGTSMATPHVAGVVALYLQAYPTASPATVKSWIVGNASGNIIELDCPNSGNCNKSPNLLLYSPCAP